MARYNRWNLTFETGANSARLFRDVLELYFRSGMRMPFPWSCGWACSLLVQILSIQRATARELIGYPLRRAISWCSYRSTAAETWDRLASAEATSCSSCQGQRRPPRSRAVH